MSSTRGGPLLPGTGVTTSRGENRGRRHSISLIFTEGGSLLVVQGIAGKEKSERGPTDAMTVGDRVPLLFHVPENTYLRAFVYVALTAAVTTGIVLEYRLVNPFGTYVGEDSVDVRARAPRVASVLQTCAVAFLATLLSLVLLHILFAMGDSLLVRDARLG